VYLSVKKNILNKEMITFLIIGGINTLFSYLVFSLLIFLKVYYIAASVIATILGILFNFKTTGTFVFNIKDNKLLFRFVGVYSFTFVINLLLLKIFVSFKLNLYIWSGVLTVVMAFVGFFLNKKFVFGVKK